MDATLPRITFKRWHYKNAQDLKLVEAIELFLNRSDNMQTLVEIEKLLSPFGYNVDKQGFHYYSSGGLTCALYEPDQSDGSAFNFFNALAHIKLCEDKLRQEGKSFLPDACHKSLDVMVGKLGALAQVAGDCELKRELLTKIEYLKLNPSKPTVKESKGVNDIKARFVVLFDRYNGALQVMAKPFADAEPEEGPMSSLLFTLREAHSYDGGFAAYAAHEPLEPASMIEQFRVLYQRLGAQGQPEADSPPTYTQQARLELGTIFEEIRKIVEDAKKANKKNQDTAVTDMIVAIEEEMPFLPTPRRKRT